MEGPKPFMANGYTIPATDGHTSMPDYLQKPSMTKTPRKDTAFIKLDVKEGHLRIEAEIKDGKIVDAYSSSTMVRGIENIVKGRDPRDVWAFAQRTCGVCTTVHAIASVRAVEDALGISIPPNA